MSKSKTTPKDKKSKSRSFTVYLLKPEFNENNFMDALKDKEKVKDEVKIDNVPSNAKFVLAEQKTTEPYWKEYFNIKKPIKQSMPGGIFFLPVKNRVFALTFGRLYHQLKIDSYEYNFGLHTTLNCVDPKALKSTDILCPEKTLRQRIQTPTVSDLTLFDFDKDSSIIKRLTGSVREEYKEQLGNISGTSSLRITTRTQPSGLHELCEFLLERYKSEDYKEYFPNIYNIEPVNDPQKLKDLNRRLLEELNAGNENINFTIPEIIDFEMFAGVKLIGMENSQEIQDFETLNLRSKLSKIEDLSITKLKRSYKVNCCDDNGDPLPNFAFSLYRTLIWDCPLGEESYHLCDGKWYKVEKNYIAQIQKEISGAFEPYELPPYKQSCEGSYNIAVAKNDPSFICLDTKNMYLKNNGNNDKIEPCDLYKVTDDGYAHYIHVKRGASKGGMSSSNLSHLFNQGVNSVALINREEEAARQLENKIKENIGTQEVAKYIEPIKNKKSKVVFAIISKRDPAEKEKALPLFSQISLRRAIRELKSMNVGYGVVLVQMEESSNEK